MTTACCNPCNPCCPCEPPRANVPPVLTIVEGGAAGQLDITLYGTPTFSAMILQNPVLLSGPSVILSAVIVGTFTLRVVTNSAQAIDGVASYAVIVRACNACGCVDIPITVSVVESGGGS
jgi:hypothetical protein